MYCPNCGKEITNNPNYCSYCGFHLNSENNSEYQQEDDRSSEDILSSCDTPNQDLCIGFDSDDEYDEFYGCGDDVFQTDETADQEKCESTTIGLKYKSNLIAGILAFYFGYFGIHNFYLRRFKPALFRLICGTLAIVMFYATQIAKIQNDISSQFILVVLLILMYTSFILGGINLVLWAVDFIFIWARAKSMKSPDAPMKYNSRDNIVFALLIVLSICSGLIFGIHEKSVEKQNNETFFITSRVTLDQYPDMTLSVFVESLIYDPKWTIVDSNTINVSGDISYWGEKAKLEIGFKINPDKTASVYAIEINGQPQTGLTKDIIIEYMYNIATAARIRY